MNDTVSFKRYTIDSLEQIKAIRYYNDSEAIGGDNILDTNSIKTIRFYNSNKYAVLRYTSNKNLINEALYIDTKEVYYKQFMIIQEHPKNEGYLYFRYDNEDSTFTRSGAIVFNEFKKNNITESDHSYMIINNQIHYPPIFDISIFYNKMNNEHLVDSNIVFGHFDKDLNIQKEFKHIVTNKSSGKYDIKILIDEKDLRILIGKITFQKFEIENGDTNRLVLPQIIYKEIFCYD